MNELRKIRKCKKEENPIQRDSGQCRDFATD